MDFSFKHSTFIDGITLTTGDAPTPRGENFELSDLFAGPRRLIDDHSPSSRKDPKHKDQDLHNHSSYTGKNPSRPSNPKSHSFLRPDRRFFTTFTTSYKKNLGIHFDGFLHFLELRHPFNAHPTNYNSPIRLILPGFKILPQKPFPTQTTTPSALTIFYDDSNIETLEFTSSPYAEAFTETQNSIIVQEKYIDRLTPFPEVKALIDTMYTENGYMDYCLDKKLYFYYSRNKIMVFDVGRGRFYAGECQLSEIRFVEFMSIGGFS